MNNHNWYAVLTADVLLDESLTAQQKLLVAAVSSMSNDEGYCFASNEDLGKICSCHKTSVSRHIKILRDKGYLNSVIHLKPNGEIDYRALTIIYTTEHEHVK